MLFLRMEAWFTLQEGICLHWKTPRKQFFEQEQERFAFSAMTIQNLNYMLLVCKI
jgi:hypothetical protein